MLLTLTSLSQPADTIRGVFKLGEKRTHDTHSCRRNTNREQDESQEPPSELERWRCECIATDLVAIIGDRVLELSEGVPDRERAKQTQEDAKLDRAKSKMDTQKCTVPFFPRTTG